MKMASLIILLTLAPLATAQSRGKVAPVQIGVVFGGPYPAAPSMLAQPIPPFAFPQWEAKIGKLTIERPFDASSAVRWRLQRIATQERTPVQLYRNGKLYLSFRP
jgi:hypothetical protein